MTDYALLKEQAQAIIETEPHYVAALSNISARYPGDDIIDMVGIDFYQFTPADEFIAKMKSSLDMTKAFAQEHGKLMAVTETGCEGVKNAKWWTG